MRRPPKIMTRPRAWGCFAMNQLAFPGLGTVMAGRKIGYVQAVVMVIGFCLFVGYMLWFFMGFAQFLAGQVQGMEWNQMAFEMHYRKFMWALWAGLGLSAVAWLWALASSILILGQCRRRDNESHEFSRQG